MEGIEGGTTISGFISEKDWERFHSPKNLAMARGGAEQKPPAREAVLHLHAESAEQRDQLSGGKALIVIENYDEFESLLAMPRLTAVPAHCHKRQCGRKTARQDWPL